MRPVSDLSKLNDALTSRLGRLRRFYSAGADHAVGRPELVAYSVIELDNLVLSGMRVLLISSVRNARTVSGVRIRSGVSLREEDEIAAFVLSIVNQNAFTRLNSPQRIDRRQEPKLRDPRDMERVFSAAGLTNTPSLQNALALNATLFANLGTFRNFYAHRNAHTWQKANRKALAMGIYAARSVDDIVKAMVPGRPVCVYEDWLDEAELFFEEACK